MPSSACQSKAGFTLIEVSVVLVIIGLIVGGILTGESLISSARQQATIAQMQKYNGAVDTFRAKYIGIPGDLLYSKAAGFGLSATTSGGTGLGDGNGLIQDGSAGGNANTPVGEILLFWRQLSDAKMVDGSYASDITVATAQGAATMNPALEFPIGKIGRQSYVLVGSDNTASVNAFVVLGLYNNTVNGGPVGTAGYFFARQYVFTPIEAYNIDVKMDDGLPITGMVQARNASNSDSSLNEMQAQNLFYNWPNWTTTPTSNSCLYGGTYPPPVSQVQYNIAPSNGGYNVTCNLRFQFQ